MKKNFMKNPQLDGETFLLKGNSIGILLLHGFTATTAEVRFLGECLHREGYTISAPLLPGHGTTPDDLNTRSWAEWLDTARQAYQDLGGFCSQVFVGGESMGALLALMLAEENPEIEGLLLFSPALKVKKMDLAYLLQYIIRYVTKNQKEDGLAWKGYIVYPVKAMVQLLRLQARARKTYKKITQPVLTFVGDQDATISTEAVQHMMTKIPSSDKTFIHMRNSPHVMLLAAEKEQICQQTSGFIKDHLNESSNTQT